MYSSRLERSHAPFAANVAATVALNVQNGVQQKMKTSQHFISRNSDVEQDLAQFYRNELKLGKMLGSGSFCEVHELKAIAPQARYDNASKAKDYKSNRKQMAKNVKKRFAVKMLRPSLLKDQKDFIEAASELVLEAKYLSTLKHPNIIGIHAVATAGAKSYANGRHDSYFVVLDRLGSCLCDEFIKWKTQGVKMKASIGTRLQIIQDLAAALEFLHDRNLVYRDLKPGNVGFDMNGKVKLFDFGLLAEVPKGEYLTQRTGTVRYMAPDCYLGKYNCKADVYSITVILWEVLTVRQYFDDLENLDHIKKVMAGQRETLDASWPSGVRALMNQGWIAESEKRPSMRSFHSALGKEIQMLGQHRGPSKNVPMKQARPAIKATTTFETIEMTLSEEDSLYTGAIDGGVEC